MLFSVAFLSPQEVPFFFFFLVRHEKCKAPEKGSHAVLRSRDLSQKTWPLRASSDWLDCRVTSAALMLIHSTGWTEGCGREEKDGSSHHSGSLALSLIGSLHPHACIHARVEPLVEAWHGFYHLEGGGSTGTKASSCGEMAVFFSGRLLQFTLGDLSYSFPLNLKHI